MVADPVFQQRIANLSPEGRLLLQRRMAELDGRRVRQLSATQRGLWFMNQLLPTSPVYIAAWRWQLRGRLDGAAFRAAVDGLIARHESLRTGFGMRAGRPVQLVEATLGAVVREDDLRGTHRDRAEEMIRRTIDEEFRERIDLSRPPLLRIRLIRLSEDVSTVLLFVHHIVFDGVSAEIVQRELLKLYDEQFDRAPSRLPEAPPYAEFSDWQREQLTGDRGDQLLGFWRDQLAGAPSVFELFSGRLRPAVQGSGGGVCRFVVPEDAVLALAELAKSRRCSLFMAYAAVLQLTLARYSGREDIPVGTPMANRETERLTGVVGMCTNVVVLRTHAPDRIGFAELLDRVRDVVLDAYEHQALPFERLVDALAPDRSTSYNPIFQVGCGLGPRAVAGIDSTRLTLETVETLLPGFSKFDLSFTGLIDEGRIEVTMEYDAALFDAEEMQRFGDHYTRLCRAAAARPDSPIGELEMLSHAELAVLAGAPEPLDAVAPAILVARHAATDPARPALSMGEHRLTYAELHAAVERERDRLDALEIGPGTPAVICAGSPADVVVAVLAAGSLGAAIRIAPPAETVAPFRKVDPAGIWPDLAGAAVSWHEAVLTPPAVAALGAATAGLGIGPGDTIAIGDPGERCEFVLAALAAGASCQLVAAPTAAEARSTLLARTDIDVAWLPMRVPATAARGPRLLVTGCTGPLAPPGALPTVRVLSTPAIAIGAVGTGSDLRPAPGVRAYVLDGGLRPLPFGVCGHLYLAAAHLTPGAGTVPNPFCAGGLMQPTGLVARAATDGSIECLGPAEDVPSVDGARVPLRLVEAAIARHPDIRDVVVVDERDPGAGHAIVAYAAVAPAVDPSDVRTFLGNRLPAYALPAKFVTVDAIPLGPDGSVDRARLRAAEPLAPSRPPGASPESALERLVVMIWSGVFEDRPVRLDDDFFDLGGHSLLAVSLLARIGAVFGVELPVSVLFTASTPAAVADLLRTRAVSEDTAAAIEQVIGLSEPEARDRPGI